MQYKIWVDLDGVLANWHKSACEVFGVPYPTRTVLYRDWIAETTKLPINKLLDQTDDVPSFWKDMELLPVAPRLISYLDVNFPDWHFLTHPTLSSVSWGGKAAWVRKYFGNDGMRRLVMMGGKKSLFADRYSVLIDDTRKIIDEWTAAGGLAFHWVEYTSDWKEAHETQLIRLITYLDSLKESTK
jgi:hypothetical protein